VAQRPTAGALVAGDRANKPYHIGEMYHFSTLILPFGEIGGLLFSVEMVNYRKSTKS
jgi:hypothetical protein